MNHALLHVEAVKKTYPSGFTLVVDRLKLDAHERVGLVGNNGAGKTTLLLLSLGLLRRDGGYVRVAGHDVARTGSWRRRTASYLGESSLISFLTPKEYVTFVGKAYDLSRDRIDRRLRRFEDFLGFTRNEERKLIREFSSGNRKKIGLVAAMITEPSLLVLDEPFAGLDPRSQSLLRNALDALNERCGTSLFVSSHDLSHVVEFCKRVVVLDGGRVVQDAPVCSGSLREITALLTKSRTDRNAAGARSPRTQAYPDPEGVPFGGKSDVLAESGRPPESRYPSDNFPTTTDKRG